MPSSTVRSINPLARPGAQHENILLVVCTLVGTVLLVRRTIVILVTTLSLVLGSAAAWLALRPSEPIDWVKRLNRCHVLTDDASRSTCLESFLRSAIDHEDYAKASEALVTVTADDVPLRDLCHLHTHALGAYMLKRYGEVGAAVTGAASSACQNGMSHGVAEAFGSSQPTMEAWTSYVTACAAIVDANEFVPDMDGCSHGLGHAVTLAYPEKPVDELLVECARFAQQIPGGGSSAIAFGCAYGVAMSNWSVAGLSGEQGSAPRDYDRVQAVRQCSESSSYKQLANGCLSGLGFSLGDDLRVLNYRPELLSSSGIPQIVQEDVRLCLSASDGEARSGCLGQYFQHTARSFFVNAEQYNSLCTAISVKFNDPSLASTCVNSAEETLPDADYEELRALLDQAR